MLSIRRIIIALELRERLNVASKNIENVFRTGYTVFKSLALIPTQDYILLLLFQLGNQLQDVR